MAMRLSVQLYDMGNPAFEKLRAAGKRVSVFLDGKEIEDCLTADEDAGMVIVFCRDESGKLIVNYQAGEVKRTFLWGKVRIKVN